MRQRIEEIDRELRAIHDGWPFFLVALESRLAVLTRALIHTNNEETRGRIKALTDLTEWPAALVEERAGLLAALADEAAADD